ncbi:trypsin alpha-3-like [Cephus cinctus]|uniref:Trypsin alpha-3-like n=1 Tax=Cephus cinctus TaxID=211228 RepID=A0AAJ7CEN1_CEPCN|nr:trypsin alpha-3-like [Cephus cinctus]
MYKFLALTALLAVASADPIGLLKQAHPLSPNGRIVGGAPTTIQEVPYQVLIRTFGSPICGGSIISENWIVTAAHCSSLPTSWYNIRAGSTFSNSGGSIHDVAAIINHDNYYSTSDGIPVNDISLYRLLTSLTLDSTRQPIPLFNSGESASVGAMAVITGWGALTQGGSSPTILQTVSVPIVSKSSCDSAYIMWGGLPLFQICAAYPEGGKDACQGDSGGPLAINGRLAGIVSWGNGCAQPGFPGVYTEVAAFRDWISTKSGV